VSSRVKCRNETCRSGGLVRQSCEMRIFCREHRTPVHAPPHSCRHLSLQPPQHLSMNAASVTGDGTGLRPRRATTQCDHEVTALNTVPCACTPTTVNCDDSCLLAAWYQPLSLTTPSIQLRLLILSILQMFVHCVSKMRQFSLGITSTAAIE